MTYDQLKEMDRETAIKIISPSITEINTRIENAYPANSDIIIFGGYWRTDELVAKFIDEYVDPKSEKDITNFFHELVYRICSDGSMYNQKQRDNLERDYQLIFQQYGKMYNHPDSVANWAESKATYIWFEYILPNRRKEQFLKIKKQHDIERLKEVSAKIKEIYNFTDLEIIYLEYFCSQTKLDELDPSLNTLLYFWSKEKNTGKTTIGSYLCSYLNGECCLNADQHKSELAVEMQIRNFDRPVGIDSQCVLLDEAGFHDMTKSYDRFKTMITSNSCKIEYKFKNSRHTKKCNRNYIMTANHDPIHLVKDETERRVLGVHFTKPKQLEHKELVKIWYDFVLECNLSELKLRVLYNEVILPNAQNGEQLHIILELCDIFSEGRMETVGNGFYFSISNVMTMPEVIAQKLSRKIVKEVLLKLYGEPDCNQRFIKSHRIEIDYSGLPKPIEIPF